MKDLVDRVLASDLRAVARAMRLADDRAPGFRELLRALWPHTGRAWVVGVTGTPGAGKSTLVDRLIAVYRSRGLRVGVVAIDPSSPYSGGAILGDRIRMARHATDDGVFIRSLATRGQLGGLSRSARDVVRILDACGYPVVLVETVGVGQDELEITRTAHSTLVVMAPGLGDGVQAIKAGILECADAFAVNKADRDGADATVRDLELMIALGHESMVALSRTRGHAVGRIHATGAAGPERASPAPDPFEGAWTPSIVKCSATRGEGIEAVAAALDAHRVWIEGTTAGKEKRRRQLADEVRQELRQSLLDAAIESLHDRIDAAVRDVDARAVDPYTATERLVAAFRGQSSKD